MGKINPNDILIITISNWEKHQNDARKKSIAKSFNWFSFSCDFFDDSRIWHAGALAQQVYLYLLCQCGKQNTNKLEVSQKQIGNRLTTYHKRVTTRSVTGQNGVRNSLEILEQLGLIQVNSLQNITEHNRTDESKDSSSTEQRDAEVDAEIPFDSPSNKPINPWAKSTEPDVPYADLLALWNRTCCPPKKPLIALHTGPIRQDAMKQHWLKHPDLAHWESWMKAYANSFWVKDPEHANKPTNPDFDRLLKNPDLIYGLLEGKYEHGDYNPTEAEKLAERERRLKVWEEYEAKKRKEGA